MLISTKSCADCAWNRNNHSGYGRGRRRRRGRSYDNQHSYGEEEEQRHRQQRSSTPASWLVSALSVTTSVVAIVCLSHWNGAARSSSIVPRRNTASDTTPLSRRLTSLGEETADFLDTDRRKRDRTIDDDITRDDTCRDYLMNFLTGTTDAKDECQAMNKAWQLSDCTDYKHNDNGDGGDGLPLTRIWSRMLQLVGGEQDDEGVGKNKSKNNTGGNSTDDDIMIDDAFERWECCGSISDFYGRRCQEEHLDAFKLLGIVLVLVVCGYMKSILRMFQIQWIPDAGACIIVGAIVGGILRLIQSNLVQDKLLAFDNDLFMQVMLPPIVFEAAISIDKAAFRRDLFPILFFAIVGTFASAVAIAFITYSLGSAGGTNLPWLDSLLFGSLMSSIDPVATLSILSSVGVNPTDTLYTLIFGESLLNDGVSIVLFESLVRNMGDADVVDRTTVWDTLGHFVLVTCGSCAIGYACGALCTLYFYSLQTKQSAVSEVALFFAWALVPYYIADGLGLSGIISIMVMGFVLDYYVIGGHQSDEGEWMEYMEVQGGRSGHHGSSGVNSRDGQHRGLGQACPTGSGDTLMYQDYQGSNHSHANHPIHPLVGKLQKACCKAFSGRGLLMSRSRHHVGFVAEVISNIMETAIFAYLGLFLFNDHIWDVLLTCSGMFACVASRAGMVVALSVCINACVWMDVEAHLGRLWNYCCQRGGGRRDNGYTSGRDDDDSLHSDTRVYLDCRTQMILFSAGVRGAVSYALVQNIPVYDAVTKHGSHFKGELRSMTSATIVVLLFLFGALTYFTVQQGPDRERAAGPLTHRLLSMSLASDEGLAADEDMSGDGLDSTFEIDGHHHNHRYISHSDHIYHPSRTIHSSNPHPPVPTGSLPGTPVERQTLIGQD